MKVTTTRSVKHTLHLDDDIELEIQHDPIESTILVERVGDKIVIAYLVQDNDGSSSNPMDSDAQGDLIIGNDRCERHKVYAALGLDSNGNVDTDTQYSSLGDKSLRDLARESIKEQHSDDAERDVEHLAEVLYYTHWRKIAPWTVPVRYDDYGSSGTRIRLDVWEGDITKLPNAVWVADKNAIENLTYDGKQCTIVDLEAYATSVISEYEKWCNGEVYGCVVEVHQQVPEQSVFFENVGDVWERLTDADLDRSCWGFVGYDYAKKALKEEFFDTEVRRLK